MAGTKESEDRVFHEIFDPGTDDTYLIKQLLKAMFKSLGRYRPRLLNIALEITS